jgi:aromatic ring hydroxylase
MAVIAMKSWKKEAYMSFTPLLLYHIRNKIQTISGSSVIPIPARTCINQVSDSSRRYLQAHSATEFKVGHDHFTNILLLLQFFVIPQLVILWSTSSRI